MSKDGKLIMKSNFKSFKLALERYQRFIYGITQICKIIVNYVYPTPACYLIFSIPNFDGPLISRFVSTALKSFPRPMMTLKHDSIN